MSKHKTKVLFSWSGGKDSALALHQLITSPDYQIVALLTTVTKDYDRVSMHGFRRTLLEKQAHSLGLPLEKIFISKKCSTEEYEHSMRRVLSNYVNTGVSHVAFGDIFLQQLREYREENLSRIGMNGIFPIWKKDTAELAKKFTNLGFRAIITCVDTEALDKTFAGRTFDEHFLSELPPGVDHCGENGEFHSFVYDGPIFKDKIPYAKGDVVLRENRFCFCDLID